MNLDLKSIFNDLGKSIAQPPHLRVFAEAARRIPALARYASASPAAVRDALRADSSLTIEQRDTLLVALLAELRATQGALWQALLVLAFEPMLVRIRARLGQPKAVRFGRSQKDDLDQRVLLAFLDAAHTLDIASHAARALRLAVTRRVFGDEVTEREAFQPAEFDDDVYEADPFEVTTREKAAANEIVAVIYAEGGAPLRDMMLATRAQGETVRGYVARVHPDLSITQRRTVERRLTAAANQVERKLRERARRPEQRRDFKAA
jgi:hypothetical protein